MANVLEDRDKRILKAAVRLAKVHGFQWITREQIAELADVSTGTVSNAYRDMLTLKRAVLQHAVDAGIVEIVAQGLATGHVIAKAAPQGLKAKALKHLASL